MAILFSIAIIAYRDDEACDNLGLAKKNQVSSNSRLLSLLEILRFISSSLTTQANLVTAGLMIAEYVGTKKRSTGVDLDIAPTFCPLFVFSDSCTCDWIEVRQTLHEPT